MAGCSLFDCFGDELFCAHALCCLTRITGPSATHAELIVAVPRGSVVTTNPTYFTVALQCQRSSAP